jgi:hypothetical protein
MLVPLRVTTPLPSTDNVDPRAPGVVVPDGVVSLVAVIVPAESTVPSPYLHIVVRANLQLMVNERLALYVGVRVHSPRHHFLGDHQLVTVTVAGTIRSRSGHELLIRCHRHVTIVCSVDATLKYHAG